MKKVSIFRVYGGSEWYRVYRRWLLGVGPVYEVYRGRKRIAGIWRYTDCDEALDAAFELARANVFFIEDGEDVQ